MSRRAGRALVLAVALVPGAPYAADAPAPEPFATVVIDAGHGGDDHGAIGDRSLLEKDLVLDVSRALGQRLRRDGLRVVMTRGDDSYVALEERTAIANDARGNLFISIHANAAPNPRIRGIETFFLSLDATDDDASLVARRENAAFGDSATAAAISDPLVAILGDLIATEHLRESSEFAHMAQRELGKIHRDHSRGVKQAPFVVLSGVQMPAALVEIGFITNAGEARQLHSRSGRDALIAALARAIHAFGRRYDARHGSDTRGANTPTAAGGGS